MSILIKDGLVITQNKARSVIKADIYIDDNIISEVSKRISTEAEYKINAKGKIVMPGLINTHAHVGMGLFRGQVEDVSLDDFLNKTFKLDSKRRRGELYTSALLSIAEMIRTGTTSFLDLYYSEDVIAHAALDAGIRAFLSWVTLDKEYTTQSGDPIRNAEGFIRKYKNRHELISPSVGFQGVYVCSDETFIKGKELSDKYDTIMHMHLAETEREVREYSAKTKESILEHLDKLGIASSRLVAAHCIWLTNKEIRAIAKRRVNVSYNATSNMKLGSGIAKVVEMQNAGANVTLGTDSVVSNNSLDMFSEMKISGLLQKVATGVPSLLKSGEILDMATVNAARALGEKNIGSIEEGKLADLIVIDPVPNALPLSKGNTISNVVYAVEGLNVKDTIINGKPKMLDGKLIGIDLGRLFLPGM